jgi:UDP-glucuronate decarboxylase
MFFAHSSGERDVIQRFVDAAETASRDLPWLELGRATVLVTGAGGFLGSAVVDALLARYDQTGGQEPASVIAVVRSAQRARRRFQPHPALQVIERDLAKTRLEFPPFDWAIHAASPASPRFYATDPVGTLLPNIVGTLALLEAARDGRCKGFLYISSGEVYGEVPAASVPTSEHEFGYLDPMNFRSCYGEGKRCGETLCAAFAKQFGVRAIVARPFHTYGPGIALDDGRVFADFVRDVVEGRNIALKSDGAATRAFCYVTDAVAGLLTVLCVGMSGEAYNVGSANGEISISGLAELLVRLFPERGLRVERVVRDDDGYVVSPITRNVPSTAKLEELGWKPMIDLEEGFRRTVRGIEQELSR